MLEGYGLHKLAVAYAGGMKRGVLWVYLFGGFDNYSLVACIYKGFSGKCYLFDLEGTK
jgi:hypothetical protein